MEKKQPTKKDFTNLKKGLARDRSIMNRARTFKGLNAARDKARITTAKRLKAFSSKFKVN